MFRKFFSTDNTSFYLKYNLKIKNKKVCGGGGEEREKERREEEGRRGEGREGERRRKQEERKRKERKRERDLFSRRYVIEIKRSLLTFSFHPNAESM